MKLLTKKESKKEAEQVESKPAYTPPTIPFPESLFMKSRPIPEARLIYMDGNIYPANIN